MSGLAPETQTTEKSWGSFRLLVSAEDGFLLVVANTATEISDLCHEARLGARVGSAGLREDVAYLVDLSFLLRGFVDVGPE